MPRELIVGPRGLPSAGWVLKTSRMTSMAASWDSRVGLRHPFDVSLVDDGLVVRRARRAIGGPLEERVDHDACHGVAQRVDPRRRTARGGIVGCQVVGEQRLGELEVAVERLAIR